MVKKRIPVTDDLKLRIKGLAADSGYNFLAPPAEIAGAITVDHVVYPQLFNDWLDSPWRHTARPMYGLELIKDLDETTPESVAKILQVHRNSNIIGEIQSQTTFWPGIRIQCHLFDFYTRRELSNEKAVSVTISRPDDDELVDGYPDLLTDFLGSLSKRDLIAPAFDTNTSTFSCNLNSDRASIEDGTFFKIWFKGLELTEAGNLYSQYHDALRAVCDTKYRLTQRVEDLGKIPETIKEWNERLGGAAWSMLNPGYRESLDPFSPSGTDCSLPLYSIFGDDNRTCTAYAVHEANRIEIEIVATDAIAMQDTLDRIGYTET